MIPGPGNLQSIPVCTLELCQSQMAFPSAGKAMPLLRLFPREAEPCRGVDGSWCLILGNSLTGMRHLHPCAVPAATPAFCTDTCCDVHGQLGVFTWKRTQCQCPVCSSRMITVMREGSDVLSSTRSLWQWECQLPPTSHNSRANTPLVISERAHDHHLHGAQLQKSPSLPRMCSTGNGTGAEPVSGVPGEPRLCLEPELQSRALVGS